MMHATHALHVTAIAAVATLTGTLLAQAPQAPRCRNRTPPRSHATSTPRAKRLAPNGHRQSTSSAR